MTNSKTAPVALLATVAMACTAEPISGSMASEEGPVPSSTVDPATVTVRPQGEAQLAPEVMAPEADTRTRRRLDIDQLDTAIRQVSGGIGWTERRGNTEVNLFEELAGTLGKPDFVEIVDEDLEPSAMFQKFLDDAARSVCDRLIEVDAQRSEADRVFFRRATPRATLAGAPDAVRANLQYLLLRFHGQRLAADAPELNPWLWLVESAEHVGASPEQVWRTVCVGLMTHPDFYTY